MGALAAIRGQLRALEQAHLQAHSMRVMLLHHQAAQQQAAGGLQAAG